MDVREFRGWLLCQPRPKWLRIVTEDQAQHKFEMTAGISYIQAATSIFALKPELVEAFDEKDTLLRAIRPNEAAEEEEEEEVSSPEDPESQRFITVAKLVAEAYRHSTEVAFEKLVALFEASNRRAETNERTVDQLNKLLTKMAVKQIEEAAAGGEPQGSLLEQMLGAFLQGQQMRAAEGAKPNGVVNGAAKPEED